MGLGGAVILFAVGAILKFATNARVSGIDLQAIGVIVMVVSAIWFVAMLAMYFSRRRTTVMAQRQVVPGEPVYGDPAYRGRTVRREYERSDYDEPI